MNDEKQAKMSDSCKELRFLREFAFESQAINLSNVGQVAGNK